MPRTKLQEVVFTVVMAALMVYGMIVFNVALANGGVTGETFFLALHEFPIMFVVAFVLEMFVVGKIAPRLAFTFVRPTDRPQVITYGISFCIVCMMCPVMSLIATFLFQEVAWDTWFPVWIQTTALNLPVAMLWQFCYVGPFARLVFRTVFRKQLAAASAPDGGKDVAQAAPHAAGEAPAV